MECDIKPGRKRIEIRSDDPMLVQIHSIRARCVLCQGKLIEIHVAVMNEVMTEKKISYCANCGPNKKNLGEWFG